MTDFQSRVQPWMLECIGAEISSDKTERCDRFIEEAFELAQSLGWDRGRALALVDYTWGRPAGEPEQEVGGVMVTLAALCLACGLDMHHAGEVELARILQPEIVERIRAKQAAKARDIPFSPPPAAASDGSEDLEDRLVRAIYEDWPMPAFSEDLARRANILLGEAIPWRIAVELGMDASGLRRMARSAIRFFSDGARP